MSRKYIFYLLVVMTVSLCGCKEHIPFAFSPEIKMSALDQPGFAAVDYDDSAWVERIHPDEMDSIFWTRIPVTIPDSIRIDEMAIKIVATSTYDFYWDGEYIGSNGTLPTSHFAEQHGAYIKNFVLSREQLESADHVVALRSSMNMPFMVGHHAYVIVSTVDQIIAAPIRFSLWMFVMIGVFLTVFVYFCISYCYNPKDYGALLFSIICLMVMALLGLEYVKHTHAYPYPFQYTRMQLIHYIHMGLAVVVPLFLMVKFEVKQMWTIILVVIVSIFCIHHWEDSFDKAAKLLNRLMWIVSMGLMIYAMIKKRQEALVLLVALTLSYITHVVARQFFFYHVSPYDVSLFVEYLIIALAMLYLTIYRRRQERLAYEESLVTSERLRNELLRKNIRPHFIMNTLTSLMDWIEESPKEGAKFIQSLSSEFRLLNDMADHKLVPITDEISLCKNHLEVMGYRKDIAYKWYESGIDHDELIPPALFLTIVENGVTHSYGAELNRVEFHLSHIKYYNQKIYKIEVKTNVPTAASHNASTAGTGTQYITSRLQESYGDKWEYTSQPSDDGWLSTIKILNL